MPLSFTTGTINAANAGAVGQAMIEQIRDDLVAHAAWELVEEYTPASVMKWYVFKCLATESGLPNDFFLIFGRTIGSGQLQAFIAEGYNSGTHVASLFPCSEGSASGTNTYTYDSNGRQTTQTFTLGIAAITTSAGQPHWFKWIPSGVSTKWWLTIDDDGMSVAWNGASNGFMHFGAYEWLGSIANDMPIHQAGSTTDTGRSHGITRNPAVASLTKGHYALTATQSPGGSTPDTLGFAGRLDQNDKLCNDQRAVSEIRMVMDVNLTAGHVNASENIGWVLGKPKRIRYGTSVPAGVAFGDAYAHNGTLWVPYLPTDGRIWDTGVAV